MGPHLAPTLTRLGLLNDLFEMSFAVYCQLGGDVRRLHELVDEMGTEKATSSGVFAALLGAQRALLQIAEAFFLTPASRARVRDEGGTGDRAS